MTEQRMYFLNYRATAADAALLAVVSAKLKRNRSDTLRLLVRAAAAELDGGDDYADADSGRTFNMDDRIVATDDISRRITPRYIDELREKIEWLEAYKYGARPQNDDTDEAAELRRLLGEARAQRDATQRALDKANRDNDALRAELREAGRALEIEIVETPRSYKPGLMDCAPLRADNTMSVDSAHSVWYSGEKAVKALVDGGAGYFVEDEEE